MEDQKNRVIRKLSGGQKKRVSIAEALLSNPQLLFLDEPTSGLDPGMDKSMMELLKNLSRNGATIILITHATSNIYLCDKVIFMGRGGKLCYFGNPVGMLDYFEEVELPDIYNKLSVGYKVNEIVDKYENKLKQTKEYSGMIESIKNENAKSSGTDENKSESKGVQHLSVLLSRYYKLITKDLISRYIILLQAPIMFLILMAVKKEDSFQTIEGAKQILFTISCMIGLMGIINSFLEIIKEKEIARREFRLGVGVKEYLYSKLIVLNSIGILQVLIFSGLVFTFVELPKGGFSNKYFLFLSILLLTIISATSIGLLISAVVKSTDQATLLMPALIIVMLVFAGVLFDLSGFTNYISHVVISRWTIEGLGTILNINNLPSRVSIEMPQIGEIPREVDMAYEYTAKHVMSVVGWLFGITCFTIGLSLKILNRCFKNNER